jgi:fatty-acyl-CoA synthase
MMVAAPGERRAILNARFSEWIPSSLHAAFDRAAAQYTERPMVITDLRSLTYREVADESHRIADGLASLGVVAGDRVALLIANYADYAPLKVAVSRLGAVAVPINYLYRAEELSYVLRQSRSKVLVTMSGFAGLDHLAILDEVEPGWESGPRNRLPDLERVVVFPNDGVPTREDVLTLPGLIRLGEQNVGAAGEVIVSGEDIGDLVYTSGTTGSPKGVLETHDAVLRCSFGSALTRAFEDGRRTLFSLPLYHMFAYVEGFLAVTWVGGTVVPQLKFDPADYLRGVAEHHASEVLAVPTMTIALLDEAEQHAYDISSLRAVFSAGAPAPTWVWERARQVFGDVEIMTGYGMTESAAGITMTRPEDPIGLHSNTVGAVKLAGCAGVGDTGLLALVQTVDPMTGEVLEKGQAGEIVISSPCVTAGFWQQPGLTAEVLADGWLRSGDLGFEREDGYWRLTGRTKELYKSGGELVMPKEVEEVLGRHPAVSQVFAIGVPDEKWGDAGWAVVVPREGAEVCEQELLAYCKENLARFKVPKQVVFVDATFLPATVTGKIQKFKLIPLVIERFAAATVTR